MGRGSAAQAHHTHTQDTTHPKAQGHRDSLDVSQQETYAGLGSQGCGHSGLLPARASLWRRPVPHIIHLLQEQVLWADMGEEDIPCSAFQNLPICSPPDHPSRLFQTLPTTPKLTQVHRP